MSEKIYNRRQFGSPSHLQTRATPENPSFNLNDPQAWAALMDGEPSESGVSVSPLKSMTVAAVWQCVQQISGDIAKLHLNCKKIGANGEIDERHPAQRIVRYKWNNETAAFHGWRTILAHALIWGNGYAFIDRNGRGDPIGLYTLLPDRTNTERVNGRKAYVTETTHEDGSPWLRTIDADDVIHVHGLSLDGVKGLNLAKFAREAIGTALATQEFQAKYFKNGVRHGGILMLPAEMSDKAKTKVEEGFAKSHTGKNSWFKTVILRDGAKFEAAQSSLRDAQMVELDEQLVRKVARFFNVAPSRVGLSDSVSYNSKAEDNQGYLDTTLSPWMLSISTECWMKLLSGANQDQLTHEFVHDVSRLLRLNRLQRFQIYAIGVRNKILTPLECRIDDEMPEKANGEFLESSPSPTGGIDKGGATPPRGPADQTGNNPAADPNPDDSKRSVVFKRRIVFHMAEQARQKAANARAFVEWVDGDLKSHRERCKRFEQPEAIVDEMVSGLKTILEKTSQDGLAEAVEKFVSQKELAV